MKKLLVITNLDINNIRTYLKHVDTTTDYFILNIAGFPINKDVVQMADVILPLQDCDYTAICRSAFEYAISIGKPIASRMLISNKFSPEKRRNNINKKFNL